MSQYLDRLFEGYRAAHKIGTDLIEQAATENRDLTPEEHETLERARTDAVERKKEIDRIQDFEKLGVAADAFRAAAAPVVEAARAERREATDMEMLRLVIRRGTNEVDGVGFMPSATIMNRREAPEITLRALQSAGGSAVETSFADFVTVYERTFTPMLRNDVVTVLNRTDGSPLVLPRVTADPNHGGTVTAEAGGINELDATISQVTLNPYKYGITNLWSSEIGQDNTIGLEDLIARTTGRELGIDIGAHLTTGNDSGQPNGFITAAANGGTASGTGSTYGTYFGPTDLVSLFYGRAEPYRTVGSWQANSTSLAQIRNARATDGQHIWQPSLVAGAPETLLGRPIYENPAMASGSAAKSVAFGDFSRYVVARVVPIRVESSIHYKFSTDQIALRTIERVDGDLVDTAAIAFLVGAAV
jgi:HK97 family phage major capsid protein